MIWVVQEEGLEEEEEKQDDSSVGKREFHLG